MSRATTSRTSAASASTSVGGLRAVDVPLRPERQHEVDAVERRPPLGVLAVALGEGVAVLAQAVADEAGVEVVGVADRRAHARLQGTGAALASVPAWATPVTLDDIRAARAVTSAVAKHTPIVTSVALSEQTGGDVVLKAESLQRTGAFKIRGAMNKLASLGAAAANGVTAGSAGNHAQALAFAARHFGVPCDIFVPTGAPITKIEACRAYGADGRRGRRLARRGVRRGTRAGRPSGAWRSATRSTTPPWSPGRARSGSSSSRTSPTWRASSCRSAAAGWRPARRSPSSRCCPHVRVDRRAGRGVRAVRRRRRRRPGPVVTLADGIAVKHPGDAHRPADRRSGSTSSSPSTRTPSPTPWCC